MHTVSRRGFLRVSGLVTAGSVAAACVPVMPQPSSVAASPTEASPALPQQAPAKYVDAPMLSELVEQGDLPPVEDRLPDSPRIISNMNGAIGKYGGTIRRG